MIYFSAHNVCRADLFGLSSQSNWHCQSAGPISRVLKNALWLACSCDGLCKCLRGIYNIPARNEENQLSGQILYSRFLSFLDTRSRL